MSEPRTIEVAIERIVPGGSGLGHAENLTVFVSDTAPGDRVVAMIDRVRGRIAFAELVEVLEASPLRTPGVDPQAGRCGGCDFQHLTYEAQLEAKLGIVRDCLHRIGGVDPPQDLTIIPSPKQWGYRARAEWQYDGNARLIGSYERGTHRICENDTPKVLRPELEAVLTDLRSQIKTGSLPTGRNEIRAAVGDEGLTMFPPLTGEPERALSVAAGDYRYRFDASCFFQANLEILPALLSEALRNVESASAPDPRAVAADGTLLRRIALDFYCGVGLFTLPLAKHFDRVYGVDSYSHAIQYARQNAAEAGFENVRFADLPVNQWLSERGRDLKNVGMAIVDPPRAGLEPTVLQGLLRVHSEWITYVSCDPATLARDLKQLIAHGYALESITALDMFPQTHHVEAVAHLRMHNSSQ